MAKPTTRMRKEYFRVLSWSLSTRLGPRPVLLQPAHHVACAVSLQPGRARLAWAEPAAAPPRGTLCSSRSTESFQLTVTSFSEIIFGFKVTEDFSPWGLQRCSKFASQR